MPDRMWKIALIFIGAAIIAVCMLVGIDVVRLSTTGPRWRRRLATAGLTFLAAVGISPFACRAASESGATASAATTNQAKTAAKLEDAPEWKHLDAIWREARDVASGKRGRYPFDRRGQQQLLNELAATESDIEALRLAGLLKPLEADALKKDLLPLVAGVRRFRPVEMKMVTCYTPAPLSDTGTKRLKERLPLLDALATTGTLNPQVLAKVLETVEQDTKPSSPTASPKMRDPHLQQSYEKYMREKESVRDRAREDIAKIRKRFEAELNQVQGREEKDRR